MYNNLVSSILSISTAKNLAANTVNSPQRGAFDNIQANIRDRFLSIGTN